MKQIVAATLFALFLTGCAGGLPPTSHNGLNEYDVLFGLKVIPEGADTDRIWSPVHQIYGGKPMWSVVWFKEKTKNGAAYELTAKPHQPAAQSTSTDTGTGEHMMQTASLFIGEIKTWILKTLDR